MIDALALDQGQFLGVEQFEQRQERNDGVNLVFKVQKKRFEGGLDAWLDGFQQVGALFLDRVVVIIDRMHARGRFRSLEAGHQAFEYAEQFVHRNAFHFGVGERVLGQFAQFGLCVPARRHKRPDLFQSAELVQHTFIAFVLQQPLHQFHPGVYFIAFFVGLLARQQYFGFDPHEGGCHDDKLGGQVNIHRLGLVEIGKEIVGDFGDRDIVNIELVPLNKKEQQVERAFEDREFDGKCAFRHWNLLTGMECCHKGNFSSGDFFVGAGRTGVFATAKKSLVSPEGVYFRLKFLFMELYDQIQEAVAYIQAQTAFQPATGIVLGTGLGNLSAGISVEAEIPYAEIPHFARSTVESHQGKLLLGRLGAHPVAVMAGRFHYYEGWSMEQVVFPVRVLKFLGIRQLILTNASGGINPHLQGGDIVVVRDHLNLLPENPLRGANDARIGPRFPDLSVAYDPDLRARALEIARREQIRAIEGVYSALQGPNLETPAEYAMLRTLGSDCTGMSSVPEVLAARHLDLPVLLLSLVTNVSFPPAAVKFTTLEDVIEAARAAEPKIGKIIFELLNS